MEPVLIVSDIPDAARLARIIAGDLYNDQFDFSERGNVPGSAWSRLPEVEALRLLEASNRSGRTVRLFLTFVAAMDRSRESIPLWRAGAKLFAANPELFDPAEVSALPLPTLHKWLSDFGVSQRHRDDVAAWRSIAITLTTEKDSQVRQVIDYGVGDALELLADLKRNAAGRKRFPMLRGLKIGPMWARIMAAPGGASIDNIDMLPVAVDVHVRRVTENLGVTNTRGSDLEKSVRQTIQHAWLNAVAATDIGGPPGIAGTCAALDPALWLFGKYGCAHCEKAGRRIPISQACDSCQYPFSSQTSNGSG